ncbi:MAG TPA: cytidine deaminase [candidate division WOR-3 bacterium]|uniref:Cytidine deaminase n=1 Tax=candidate division WOR-3 bacterium TaxID=2052148 RepID=A0A9C9JZN8_UNCW3|nr:cytidine deaminase [candidate division WOR-3 bacterium]
MGKTSSNTVWHSKKLSKELIKAVKKAVKFAYAPYSKKYVAAALYCNSQKIYTGVNIENSAYPLTMCAERTALFKAVSEGERAFKLLLLYSPQIEFILPCGGCLQVLSEFAPELMVVTMNSDLQFKFYPLKQLLTKPFRYVDINKGI